MTEQPREDRPVNETAALLDKWRTDLGKVLGDELVIELGRRGAGELLDLLNELDARLPAPCVMTYTPPMDFAQCETHDETFPLGETCRFDGRDMVAVLFDAVDEQRGRAVRAMLELERLEQERTEPAVLVTTAEELDALPVDSVVVDRHDIPRTKRSDDTHADARWTNAGRYPLTSSELADGYYLRVVYNPKG